MSADKGGFADSGVRSRPRAGDRIGKYEVIGKLASGGMAELFVAKRGGLEGFQKVVVLKRILPHLAENPDFVEMFLAEARLAATLEHPNIVHVSDIGKEGTDFFFTMAYIHGKDLLALLRRSATLRQRFPLNHALTVALGICAGLHYAHEQVDFQGRPLGIVHRDVSPANVLVTWHGNVKVVDFGIAKAATQTGVTQVGVRKGKASYMSPEQCRAKDVDRRTDIWAIGVVLYEITTMTRLFKAENELAIMHRIVTGDVPAPHAVIPDYPPALEQIVMRCLEIDPARRYPSAQALRRDLEAFAHDHRISTSTDALGEYLRQLYPPDAQQLPWATSTQMRLETGPQHVPAVAQTEAPTRVTSSGPVPTPTTPGTPLQPETDPTTAATGMTPGASAHGMAAGASASDMRGGTSPGTSTYGSGPGRAQTRVGSPSANTTVPAPVAPQPIPGTPGPPVDPRNWESGGTTDTDGPGQVTRTGRDDSGVPGRPVAAWVTAAVVLVAAVSGAATWALWPDAPTAEEQAPGISGEPAIARSESADAGPAGALADRLTPDEMLVLVNQPQPALALDYPRRHALLARLADGDGPEPDAALQARLDLIQSKASPDPCDTFGAALGALERAADIADLKYVAEAEPPPGCPAELTRRLQALRKTLSAAAP